MKQVTRFYGRQRGIDRISTVIPRGALVAQGPPETLRGSVTRGYTIECRAHATLDS